MLIVCSIVVSVSSFYEANFIFRKNSDFLLAYQLLKEQTNLGIYSITLIFLDVLAWIWAGFGVLLQKWREMDGTMTRCNLQYLWFCRFFFKLVSEYRNEWLSLEWLVSKGKENEGKANGDWKHFPKWQKGAKFSHALISLFIPVKIEQRMYIILCCIKVKVTNKINDNKCKHQGSKLPNIRRSSSTLKPSELKITKPSYTYC